MNTMHAITIDGDRLDWVESVKPIPGPGEVCIRVRASAVNRADLMQRRGLYPPPPGASEVMGLECSGLVEEVGKGVRGVKPGDEVCALLAGGGYAEFALAPAGSVVPVPSGMDLTEAAALPEVFATAWLNLYMEAAMQPGELALVHAGASGVGTAAVQLCREFGNPVFVTAGEDDKIQRCLALGAAGGHNRQNGSFAAAVQAFAAQSGAAPARVDVVLDPVGAPYLAANLAVLATGGRLLMIGLMGGRETSLDLAVVMSKRLRIIGSTLRTRSAEAKAEVMSQLQERVWPLISDGQHQAGHRSQICHAGCGRGPGPGREQWHFRQVLLTL